MNKFLDKADKWLKIGLIILGQITLFAFAISSIVLVATPDKDIYLNYSKEMAEAIIQMKGSFLWSIWIIIPCTTIVLIFDIWKIYIFFNNKKEVTKTKR